MKKEKIGYLLLAILAQAGIAGMMLMAPVPQNEEYHLFSDQDVLLGIPNFWNVVSNLPFVWVGLLGIFKLKDISGERMHLFVFFAGIALVGLGSGYYHWSPNNDTLIWDRLPMTIAFMALFSIVVGEFLGKEKGRMVFIPALLIGVSSVIYWAVFNDLRFYALVQFCPLLTIPVILIFFRSPYNKAGGYWLLLAAYVLAKLFEEYDGEIREVLIFMGGHPLKHLAAAMGIFLLFRMYLSRTKG